jgi:ABC-type transport system involved in cytochrome c biogenesis permease subunit
MHLEKITLTCFGASYAVALLGELLRLVWPRAVPRFFSLGFGAAGLLAHTLFLVNAFFLAGQGAPPSSQLGSTLFLAWILAIFYLYGAVHHRRQAWGVFVLPVVLILIGLAMVFPPGREEAAGPGWFEGKRLWGLVHAGLLALAAVGVSVGFVASLMYLVQVRRLRDKVPPQQGLRLFSLERLEEMNRRAITLAFPLLTAGLLIGLFQVVPELAHAGGPAHLIVQGLGAQGVAPGAPPLGPMMQTLVAAKLAQSDAFALAHAPVWTDPRVLGAGVLWPVFAILLYLRYGAHLRGRRVALLTIVAFVLLLFTLVAWHTGVRGGGP